MTVYRKPGFKGDPDPAADPADGLHGLPQPARPPATTRPNDAVDEALYLGRIDRTLPVDQAHGGRPPHAAYATKAEGERGSRTGLAQEVRRRARARTTPSPRCSAIYRTNFFPEMKADWSKYPENIGHLDCPGCFRCHDGQAQVRDRQAGAGDGLQQLPRHPRAGLRRGPLQARPERRGLQAPVDGHRRAGPELQRLPQRQESGELAPARAGPPAPTQ